MKIEVIPFKLFIAPSTHSLSLVDGGLTFFVGVGVALTALTVAEKMGFNVNKGAVRWSVRILTAIFVLWAVFTSGFLSHVLLGW